MKKRLAALLAAVLCLGGCGLDMLDQDLSEKVDEKIEQNAVNKTIYDQEKVNEEVVEGLKAGKTKIVFDGVVSTDMVQNAIDLTGYTAPEVFWTGGFTVSTDYSTTTLECETIFGLDETQLAEMTAEMQAVADELAEKASAFDSDYEKLLSLHNSLIEICDYDYDAYDSISKAADDDAEAAGYSGSAYGCLVKHKAVCEGYAKAFMLVAQKLGFECGLASGIARGDRHAWNYVKADGEYYWIDVTWDENATENDTAITPMYRFFLVNDEIINKDHSVGSDVPFVPQCTSMADNYYVHSGLYLESYDFGTVDSIMSANSDKGGADIMFATDEAYAEAVSDLIDGANIWNTAIGQSGIKFGPYFADEDYRTITLTW